MINNMRRGIPNLMKEGSTSLSGLEQAVLRNIEACKQLTDVTRTSFGPNGMNKMIINHLGKIFVTTDCATIMQEMEIQHPAARLVMLASQMQEKEIGDGSNLVVCLAGSLLAKAEGLLRMGLHPSEVIQGYKKASRRVLEMIDELTAQTFSKEDLLNEAKLAQVMRWSIGAKQHGNEDFLAPLVAKACLSVMPANTANFNVDNVRVCKLLGGNLHSSEVVKGMVFPQDTVGWVKECKDACIAVFTCSLGVTDTEAKGTVLIENADQLMNFNKSEEKEVERMVQDLVDSGVNCVVTGSSVDDIAMHFLAKAKIMVLRLRSKFELRRLCRTTKAQALVSLGPVAPRFQGHCSRIFVKEIGLTKVTIFEQAAEDDTGVATILLRSATTNVLQDIERAVNDGVNQVKAMCKFAPAAFVPGAGASDIELARQLFAEGSKAAGLEQYSIKAFAEALEVVPRTLAENAGMTAIDIISGMYAAHEKGNASAGVDIEGHKVASTEIMDLAATKKQAFLLACDAVITILRVDQIIQAKPAGGPKIPKKQTNWDAD